MSNDYDKGDKFVKFGKETNYNNFYKSKSNIGNPMNIVSTIEGNQSIETNQMKQGNLIKQIYGKS